ncbi:unnamed protein product [Owenia fusiformis]|uniref:Egal-1 winged helix domain-containing protein n=1 Tax=Owenia fusiformis TaxID=6347 RepID=A0A8J1XEU1_OWEFU|nr:unnamed protein product [Owenia fusiformis]
MAEDPSHKAMLYFLEVLMNSTGPLTISQLAGRFGSRTFTSEMRQAAGGNEVGLKKFLLKWPSLFTVKGNMVSLFDGSVTSSDDRNGRDGSPASSLSSGRSLPDVSMETEAVQYFQQRLIKKEETWVPIKSLAGHLSQASLEVRTVVGPQADFRRWLIRHPHIFEVKGENVSLCEGLPGIPLNLRHPIEHDLEPPRPRANSGPSRKKPQSLPVNKAPYQAPVPSQPTKRSPITMTANEYKAVMFLKEIIEKNGDVKLHSITGHFSQAPESVRNTIGWAKIDLEDFLRRNATIFHVHGDSVTVNKNARMHVLITGSRPQSQRQAVQTLVARKGECFHVAKLWGIIDLGKHEHVFFDKSILPKSVDDLQKYFHQGEMLNFNAVLAPKASRAKWRATRVWKEAESQPSEPVLSPTSTTSTSTFSSSSTFSASSVDATEFYPPGMSPTTRFEDEMSQVLSSRSTTPDLDDYDLEGEGDIEAINKSYGDAAPSGAGVIPVWNFRTDNLDDNITVSDPSGQLSMVPESYQMIESSLGDIRAMAKNNAEPSVAINGVPTDDGVADAQTKPQSKETSHVKAESQVVTKKFVNAGCQTVSTGEILATQLYQD